MISETIKVKKYGYTDNCALIYFTWWCLITACNTITITIRRYPYKKKNKTKTEESHHLKPSYKRECQHELMFLFLTSNENWSACKLAWDPTNSADKLSLGQKRVLKSTEGKRRITNDNLLTVLTTYWTAHDRRYSLSLRGSSIFFGRQNRQSGLRQGYKRDLHDS